jgi:hypothetical protein
VVIKFIHSLLDFSAGNGCQIPLFREILSNESVGVLVQAAFPGGIRMREESDEKVRDMHAKIGQLMMERDF